MQGSCSREQIAAGLTRPGIIAIIRSLTPVPASPVCEALISGGVTAIEITMTTPGALAFIRDAREVAGERAFIGVGTILTPESCRAAVQAGAEFVVTPVCKPELVQASHDAGRPIMLGAYTPTEVQAAHEAGADFIKLFPADTLGPAYVRSLLAPLPHVRIVPTGGVEKANIADFLKAGCAAVGVGSALMNSAILRSGDWASLTQRASELVAAARLARGD